MPSKPVSRRALLRTAGIALGAATVACCGLSYLASQAAPTTQAPDVEIPSFVYGEESMTNKGRILVAYATRTGSTVGVAEAVGETLAGRGFQADVRPFKENPALRDYSAVVLGSAINGGRWLPEAADYVKAHQAELNRLPLALFCVHIMNLSESRKQKRLAYLNPIRKLVRAVDEAFFAGIGMDPATTSPIAIWAFKLFNGGEAPEGDNRDWGKIHGWAEGVFSE